MKNITTSSLTVYFATQCSGTSLSLHPLPLGLSIMGGKWRMSSTFCVCWCICVYSMFLSRKDKACYCSVCIQERKWLHLFGCILASVYLRNEGVKQWHIAFCWNDVLWAVCRECDHFCAISPPTVFFSLLMPASVECSFFLRNLRIPGRIKFQK